MGGLDGCDVLCTDFLLPFFSGLRREKRPSITSRRRSSAISDDLISPLNQDAALPITLDQIDESTADHEINLDEFDEEGFFLTVDLSAIEAELVAVR